MDSAQSEAPTKINDDAYLRILQVDQEQSNSRWSLTSFFMSLSFAILGFSFQANLSTSTSLAIRICGLLIYWFTYVLYLRFLDYNKVLRTYLLEMEKSGRTSFDIQGRTKMAVQARSTKLIGSSQLLMYFGLLYTVGVVLLQLLGL